MRSPARPLFLLHSDAVLREQIRRASADAFECIALAEWTALEEALDRAPSASLAVVDPYAGSPGRKELSPRLHTVLNRFPQVNVLAALELQPARFHDLRTLGEWGVTDVIALGRGESTESVVRKLRSARGRALRTFIADTLGPLVPSRGRAILGVAAEIASTGGQGRDLAQALNLSERSLVRWCERANLPPPRRTLAWMRILHAAELLDHPERTVLNVAHTCGYSTDSSLRRSLQDLVGDTPSRLRRRGAFDAAAEAFAREIAGLREAAGRRSFHDVDAATPSGSPPPRG